jgi:hypothetical protein
MNNLHNFVQAIVAKAKLFSIQNLESPNSELWSIIFITEVYMLSIPNYDNHYIIVRSTTQKVYDTSMIRLPTRRNPKCCFLFIYFCVDEARFMPTRTFTLIFQIF